MTREEIVKAARKYVGIPYVLHGRSPILGLDCWGFFSLVCRDVGLHPAMKKKSDKKDYRLIHSVFLALKSMEFISTIFPKDGDALVRVHHNMLAGHTAIKTSKGMVHITSRGVSETTIKNRWIAFEFPGVN